MRPGLQPRLRKQARLSERTPSRHWQSAGKPLRWLQQRVNHVILLAGRLRQGGRAATNASIEAEELQRELRCPALPLPESTADVRRCCIDSLVAIARGDLAEVGRLQEARRVLSEQLHAMRARADAQDTGSGLQRWREWLRTDLRWGARTLHRWTRLPQMRPDACTPEALDRKPHA